MSYKHTHGSSGGRQAFTLVELLTTIAIIALIASLLLPALTKAKIAARTAKCASNLRQLSIGLQLYADDHGFFPPHTAEFGKPALPGTWYVHLEPYVLSTQVTHTNRIIFHDAFLCTESYVHYVRTHFSSGIESMTNVIVKPPYGYNAVGTLIPRNWYTLEGLGLSHHRVASVLAPSEMIAFGCDGGIEFRRVLLYNRIVPRHREKVNMIFCDSHVELRKVTSWTERSPEIRRLFNIDNQPHPETWK